MASHDSAEMLNVADRIVYLKDGKNVMEGTVADLYKNVDKARITVPIRFHSTTFHMLHDNRYHIVDIEK